MTLYAESSAALVSAADKMRRVFERYDLQPGPTSNLVLLVMPPNCGK